MFIGVTAGAIAGATLGSNVPRAARSIQEFGALLNSWYQYGSPLLGMG